MANPKAYHGGRPKLTFRSASKEMYNLFIQENKNTNISFKQYIAAIREINHQYVNLLLNGKIIWMPFGLGTFYIFKGKVNAKKINWGATNKANENKKEWEKKSVIYHTNGEHYLFGSHWDKITARFFFKEIWSFKFAKKNKFLLRDTLLDPDKDPQIFIKNLDYKI